RDHLARCRTQNRRIRIRHPTPRLTAQIAQIRIGKDDGPDPRWPPIAADSRVDVAWRLATMCELTLGCAVPGSLFGHAGRSGPVVARWAWPGGRGIIPGLALK